MPVVIDVVAVFKGEEVIFELCVALVCNEVEPIQVSFAVVDVVRENAVDDATLSVDFTSKLIKSGFSHGIAESLNISRPNFLI